MLTLSKKANLFWKAEALNFTWDKLFSKIYSPNKKNILSLKWGRRKSFYKRINGDWFVNGHINIYYNLITRHLKKTPNKIAISTLNKSEEIKSYSYREIDNFVLNFENLIKKIKSKKISKVMIHSSSSIESAVSMLAFTKLGIQFSVLFESLDSEAIMKRVELYEPNLFITRLTKKKFNKKNNKILKKLRNKTKLVFFENYDFKKKINQYYKNYKAKSLNANSNFFTLFTSGSTGIPKGVTHSIGGYSVFTNFTAKKQFGMNSKSVVLTASDAGWINGHTYALFGPLFLNAETILVEDPFILLNEKLFHKVLIKRSVSILYLPVTLIRMQKSLFKKILKKNFLKTIGSMGEHLAPNVAKFYSDYLNLTHKAIINTYFQTETGGVVISPNYKQSKKQAPDGSVGSPCAKFITTNKLSSKKKEIKLTSPFPGLMKELLIVNTEKQNYFDKNGFFRMFDVATIKKKNIYIHGRNDDVISLRGHRIGCEEVERIIMDIKHVVETAVISVEDELEGSVIYLFIVTQNKKSVSFEKIKSLIYKNFGSFAIPKKIFFLPSLPKTKSGKVMRRVLRNILLYKKKNIGDISTIRDMSIINKINKIIHDN